MVMSAIELLCDGQEACLISPIDIMSVMPNTKHNSAEKVDKALNLLHEDGYFDIISSERKGEKMYVITLKEEAFSYKRHKKQIKRDIVFKIFLALIGATATFIFGLILNAIFGNK